MQAKWFVINNFEIYKLQISRRGLSVEIQISFHNSLIQSFAYKAIRLQRESIVIAKDRQILNTVCNMYSTVEVEYLFRSINCSEPSEVTRSRPGMAGAASLMRFTSVARCSSPAAPAETALGTAVPVFFCCCSERSARRCGRARAIGSTEARRETSSGSEPRAPPALARFAGAPADARALVADPTPGSASSTCSTSSSAPAPRCSCETRPSPGRFRIQNLL